jgi:hypothetical protein
MALDTILNITANTRPAEQQIDRLTSKNYGIKLNIDSQPLGRITGQLSEFNKSMDAANARVVAFGASAGAIAVLEKSFRAMIDSTIQVEKSLKDIQVVLDVSGESMAKFGKGLFDIAKNTGQSFSVAAEAATEFSRQGLSMEDTLKRTSDALILSRLSGLGAAESVNVLTAAVNSFANQGVTATEVVNKLATVDAAFAVSSKDLAEGISRVGASASQSGVSIDELIGLITSAQQATARGGAVIGNSFKTIFTRLERGKTQSLLESLGVDTKDETGKIKSTVDMLKDLAKVYGTLGQGKQAEVAEKVGGVFQINILKAALADLGKEHSVYAGAVDISNNATDEATKRNEKLNETYAAQINRLQQGATQLAAAAGKRVLAPSMDRVIGTGNGILDSLNNIDSSSIGAKLGQGLLDGIGQVIAGPGLVLLGGVIIKLLGDFSKFAGGSVKELLGLNSASKEQAAIQSSITKLLEKNPALLAQINSEARTQSDQAKILLDFYMKQTAEMQKQAALTGQLASKLYTGGVRMGTEGVPVTKKAAGYIPEFASEEAQAKMLGAHNPKAEWGKGTIGGQRFIKNSEETEIVGFGSNGDSAVIPHYAGGYVPNFAGQPARRKRQSDITASENREKRKQAGAPIDLGDQERVGLIYATRGATLHRERGSFTTRDGQQYIASIWAAGPQLPQSVKKDEADVSKLVEDALRGATNSYIKTLGGAGGLPTHEMKEGDKFSNSGSIRAAIGTAFETAITRLTDEGMREGGEIARIDFSSPSGKLRNLFDNIKSEQLEAKYSNSPKLVSGTLVKGYDEGLLSGIKTKKAASGYIPNFADALHESIAREISAGAPANEIYVKKYSQLASENNPDGYGVFNRRDEGSTSREMAAMKNKGYAKGYIPNFADEGGGQGAGLAGGASALIDLVFVMSLLKSKSGEATEATRQKVQELAKERDAQVRAQQSIIKTKEAFIEANKGIGIMSSSVMNASRDIGFANQKIAELSKLSFGQKVGQIKESVMSSGAYQGANKFLSGAGGTGLMVAPMITSQITSLIPQDSQNKRGASQTVSSLGQVASYAGMGAMMGGPLAPITATVGAVAGSIIEIPKVIKAFTDKLPDLTAVLDKAKDDFLQFDAPTQEYLKATDELNSAIENGSASQKEITALMRKRADILDKQTPEQQQGVLQARAEGGTTGEVDFLNAQRQSKQQAVNDAQKIFDIQKLLEASSGGGANDKTKDAIRDAILSGITKGSTGKDRLDLISKIDTKQLRSDVASKGLPETINKLTGSEDLGMAAENIVFAEKNIAKASEEEINSIIKRIEKIKENAQLEQQAADITSALAEKRREEAQAAQQNASAIEKQIGLIQAATAAFDQQLSSQQERVSMARKFGTERSQTRRSNIQEITESITGEGNQNTRDKYLNKISNINESSQNDQRDIIEKAKLEAIGGVNKQLMNVYDVDKKSSASAPTETQSQGVNIKPSMSNRFDNAVNSQFGTQQDRNEYISSIGKGEIKRQEDLGAGVGNAYQRYAESGGSAKDKEQFQVALSTELGKLADSGKIDSQELRNVVLQNVQKGEQMRQSIERVKDSAKMEVDKTNQELQKMVILQGLMASAKTFGGGMSALEGGKTTSTPELPGLISAGIGAQKNKDDKQRLINSGMALSSTDVGNRNIAENYMKVNRVLREKYQGGLKTNANIGSGGGEGAEELMVSEIKKAMTKDVEETRKSFKVKGTPKEYGVMNTRAENAMIANVSGKDIKEVEKLSGKDREAEMTKALEGIARVKVAQETGDKGVLKGNVNLEKMMKQNKTPDEKLLSVEEESKGLLQKIFDQLSAGNTAVEQSGKSPIAEEINKNLKTPVDYSKFGDDADWRKEQEAKEKEMDRQSRIQKTTLSLQRSGIKELTTEEKEIMPKLKSGYAGIAVGRVNKEMANEEREKNKKQQQEAAGGQGGGGNVTVAAPQINITVNGGAGGAGGADELHRNVNSLIPELKVSIEKVVKETFERRVNSLEGRMDRVAMSNQAAKPIPVGVDKKSTV